MASVNVEYQRVLDKVADISARLRIEEQKLDLAFNEGQATLARIVANTWMRRTLPDAARFEIDPLLAAKFRTRAGYSTIRLEKILLEVDAVESFGEADLRAKRKEVVMYVQKLLDRAETLNKKARRIVALQDRLAEIAKVSVRGRKQNKVNAAVSQVEARSECATAATTPKSPAAKPDIIERAGSASMEEVMAEQEMNAEQERIAQEHYEKAANDKMDEVSEEEEDEEEQPQAPKRKQELQEPKVIIKEHPRAYIMLLQDPNVRRAKVSVDRHSRLNIAVPGRAPLKYELGRGVNVNAITKEVNGDYMQLVLPKVQTIPVLRSGRPAAPFGFQTRPVWDFEDFWSRF